MRDTLAVIGVAAILSSLVPAMNNPWWLLLTLLGALSLIAWGLLDHDFRTTPYVDHPDPQPGEARVWPPGLAYE